MFLLVATVMMNTMGFFDIYLKYFLNNMFLTEFFSLYNSALKYYFVYLTCSLFISRPALLILVTRNLVDSNKFQVFSQELNVC